MYINSHNELAYELKEDLTESTVHTGGCIVDRIVINAIGTACLFELKDDTTVLVSGTLANTELPHSAELGLPISTSLKVEMSGTGAGSVLILYRV